MKTVQSITDKRYPKCSSVGLLRNGKGDVTVSSAALHRLWGDAKYQRTIAQLDYSPHGGWAPESVEPHLQLPIKKEA